MWAIVNCHNYECTTEFSSTVLYTLVFAIGYTIHITEKIENWLNTNPLRAHTWAPRTHTWPYICALSNGTERNETNRKQRSKFAILKHILWNKRLHLCCKSSKRFYFLRNSIYFYVLFMQISVHSFMRNLYGFCWSISRFHLIAYADLSHSQMMHRFYCLELYETSVAKPINALITNIAQHFNSHVFKHILTI